MLNITPYIEPLEEVKESLLNDEFFMWINDVTDVGNSILLELKQFNKN